MQIKEPKGSFFLLCPGKEANLPAFGWQKLAKTTGLDHSALVGCC